MDIIICACKNMFKKSALGGVGVLFLMSSLITAPQTASTTMLGPCDHLNNWSTLRVGDKDTNISDIGPIAGLQQMIGERDLVNQELDASGKGGFISGTFDDETKDILILWQRKQEIKAWRTDAEAGKVGEKTLAVAKNYCAGATNARGDIVMSGPTVTYTLYFPQKGGGFGSVTSYPLPKYTSRVADHALRILLSSTPFGSSVCNDPKAGSGCYGITNNGRYVADGYRGITVENGVATVGFNQIGLPFFDNPTVAPLVSGAIERTLKQFPTISQVRYKVLSFNDAAPPSERIFDGSSSTGGTDVASKIASLLAQIKTLHDLIAQLTGGTSSATQLTSSVQRGHACINLRNDLWIGKGDNDTEGEVTLLQQFLVSEDVYPERIISGYYGNLTAQAVVRWQKAHDMGFVTTKSGVGPMTRAKMKCQ